MGVKLPARRVEQSADDLNGAREHPGAFSFFLKTSEAVFP
jgi:hypothetical protein